MSTTEGGARSSVENTQRASLEVAYDAAPADHRAGRTVDLASFVDRLRAGR